MTLAVFSHWLLDVLVHGPEMPLTGEHSARIGLGLWHKLPVALIAEGGLTMAGLALFLRGAALSRPRKMAMAALVLLILALTIMGMTLAPPPPSAMAVAASSLATLIVVCLLAIWLGRRRCS